MDWHIRKRGMDGADGESIFYSEDARNDNDDNNILYIASRAHMSIPIY